MSARRLCYAAEALADLADIRAYLTKEASREVAGRMIERLRARIRETRKMPRTGTPRPEYRPNCRFVTERPYIIYYDFDGEVMLVLRVLHSARDRDAIMASVVK